MVYLGYAQGSQALHTGKTPKAAVLDPPKGQSLAHVRGIEVIDTGHPCRQQTGGGRQQGRGQQSEGIRVRQWVQKKID